MSTLGSNLFQDTRQIERITFDAVDSIEELPEGLLHHLSDLTTFNFNFNQTPLDSALERVPRSLFRDTVNITQIILVGDLDSLPSGFFDNTPDIEWLALDEAGIETLPDAIFEPILNPKFTDVGRPRDVTFRPAISPRDVSGAVQTVIALDGNPQPSPWGENLVWTWTQKESCDANADTVESGDDGHVSLSDADTATPEFTAGSSLGTLYFRADVRSKGGWWTTGDAVGGHYTATGCATVAVCAADILSRTPQVLAGIIATADEVPSTRVSNCSELTAEKLATIGSHTGTDLSLTGKGIDALKPNDFSGLTGLLSLELQDNKLDSLPTGVFDDLDSLGGLWLSDNDLSVLPAGIFDNLAELDFLQLADNEFATLRADVFDDLTKLDDLDLQGNALTSLPDGIFDQNTRLIALKLNDNELASLPNDIFEKLTALQTLHLNDNPGAPFKPKANAGTDRTVTPGTTGVTLSGTATGPWGDARVTYAWEQVDGASSTTAVTGAGAVTLSDAAAASPTFPAPSRNATLHFKLVATPVPAPDGDMEVRGVAASDPDWVTITVGTGSGSRQVAAPSVTAVSVSSAPGGDGQWSAGEAAEAVLTFAGAVTVNTKKGTPSVQLELGTDTARKTAAYTSGSGTTALTFRYTLATDEGPHDSVRLTANSLALNGGTIRSTETDTDVALGHDGAATTGTPAPGRSDAPTAAFASVPHSHDGETAFEVELTFSGEPDGLGYATVRDSLLEVTGAVIEQARRKTRGSDAAWRLTVRPTGPGDVTLTLPVRKCTAANAVCIGGEPLASAATATIAGPPFTASFDGAPTEHDGSAFTASFRMSVEPDGLSWRTVRDSLFEVTGGTVQRARRLTQGSSKGWTLTVVPSGYGAVTLDLIPTTDCAGTPGVCDASGRMLEGPLSLTVEGPPTLSVADAEVDEAEDATLDFAVTLSRAIDETLTVDYATSDGNAVAGVDYTAASGTLTFAAGETTKTVSVSVSDDAHDEGTETLTLTLSNPAPSRVKLEDATATGSIRNTDPMPKAWMVRFGRTVGAQVVDAMDARLRGDTASHVTVGGISLGGAGEEPAVETDDPFTLPDWAKTPREAQARSMSAQELLLGSSFHLSSREGNATGPAFTAWGRIATGGFETEEDGVTLDGDVTTGLVGFDAEWERALAGVMLSHSEGEGDYTLDAELGDDRGTVESDLTGVYPYGRIDLDGSMSLWALAGAGSGELTLMQEGERAMPTDLSMRMAAGGVRGTVLDEAKDAALTVRIKSDAMWVGMKSADTAELAPTEGDVTRLRLVVEGERTFETAGGGAFTPSAEVGVRLDGGDAETGVGVEAGAGLRYRRGAVSVEGRVRTLLAHEASGYEEWGMSGAIEVAPGEGGRGLTLAIRPEWGSTGSRTESLWSAQTPGALGTDADFEATRRLALDAGYGFALANGRGTLTPYAGMTFGEEAARTMRTGAKWTLGSDVALGIEGTQRESPGADATSEIRLRGAVRF